MYRKILIKLCYVAPVFVIIIALFYPFGYTSRVVVNGKVFSVEVVDTQALLQKGLSGHTSLSDSQGMFFVFGKPGNYGFWMKDMTFPLDIIWTDANFKIVHIEKSLSPSTYPKIFYPNAESEYVLEVSAGQADMARANIGDTVTFLKK